MKTIELTQGYKALVDDEDFEWLKDFNWYAHVKRASEKPSRKTSIPYAVRKDKGKTLSMAAAILGHHGLLEEGKLVDHVNGNRLDNQKANLRPATYSQNQRNQVPRAHSSIYKGVSWDAANSRWEASIRKDFKKVKIGRFSSEEEAARAYDKAALETFGQYAAPNFPKEK